MPFAVELKLLVLAEVVARACDEHELAALLFYEGVDLGWIGMYLLGELPKLFEFGGAVGVDHQMQLANCNLHALVLRQCVQPALLLLSLCS